MGKYIVCLNRNTFREEVCFVVKTLVVSSEFMWSADCLHSYMFDSCLLFHSLEFTHHSFFPDKLNVCFSLAFIHVAAKKIPY